MGSPTGPARTSPVSELWGPRGPDSVSSEISEANCTLKKDRTGSSVAGEDELSRTQDPTEAIPFTLSSVSDWTTPSPWGLLPAPRRPLRGGTAESQFSQKPETPVSLAVPRPGALALEIDALPSLLSFSQTQPHHTGRIWSRQKGFRCS